MIQLVKVVLLILFLWMMINLFLPTGKGWISKFKGMGSIAGSPSTANEYSFGWWMGKLWRGLVAILIVHVLAIFAFPHLYGVLIKNPWFLGLQLGAILTYVLLAREDPTSKKIALSPAGKFVMIFIVAITLIKIYQNWPYWTFNGDPVGVQSASVQKADQKSVFQEIRDWDKWPWNWDKPDPLKVAIDNAKIYSGAPGETITVVIPPAPDKPGDPGEWVKVYGNTKFNDPPRMIKVRNDRMTALVTGPGVPLGKIYTEWFAFQSADNKPVELPVKFLPRPSN